MRGQSKKDNRSNCWTVKMLLHENQLSALQATLRSSALEVCVMYLQLSPMLSSLSCQTELGRESGKPQFFNFFFSVQLFSHSWARQELWDYLQIAYYLKCNLCNWSYQSYLFSQTKQFQDHKRGFSLVPPALPVRLPRWSLSDVFSHDFHFTDLFSGKKIC